MNRQLSYLARVRAILSLAALTLGLWLVGPLANVQAADGGPDKAKIEADEKTIRETAEEFAKAFNKGDAKAIGAMWAPDAEYTDENGVSFSGRDAIEKEYEAMLAANKGAKIDVTVESVRLFGPDVAIEKGIAKVTSPGAAAPSASRYTVVHARRDGKWVMVVGHDAPYVSVADGDYLRDLGFLIGDWKAEGRGQELQLHFEWMAQKNFIKNTFTAVKEGKSTLVGEQIIGWDPKLGKIVSWHFAAEGGFGHDIWTKDGSKWVIDATGVLRDGSDSTAVNTITPVDANSFFWQSTDRTLDRVRLPGIPAIKAVRVSAQASK
jgi:uncharacterized protein (TIGR02246 family)